MQQLALAAPVVVGCNRQLARPQLGPDRLDHGQDFLSERRGEVDAAATAGRGVPHISDRHIDPQHLLQSDGLGTDL